MENIGSHIKHIRDMFEISMEEMSESTGISVDRLEKIEANGLPAIFLWEAKKISESFGMDFLSELVDDDVDPMHSHQIHLVHAGPSAIFYVEGYIPRNVTITSLNDLQVVKNKKIARGVKVSVAVMEVPTEKPSKPKTIPSAEDAIVEIVDEED